MVSDLLFRLRALLRRQSMEAELDEELRSHLEHQVEKYIQSGMSRREAESRARFDFGSLEQVKEACRNSWGVKPFDRLAADLRAGLRSMIRSPGVALVAVLALALGVLANPAIFGIVDTAAGGLLPHSTSDQMALGSKHLERPARVHVVKPAFVAWKAHKQTVEPAGIVGGPRETKLSAEVIKPAAPKVTLVTAGAFRVPGIQQISADTTALPYAEVNEGPVAVISEVQEQTPFGPGLTVLNMTFQRGDVSCTFVEVIPGSLRFSSAGVQPPAALSSSAALLGRGNVLTITMRLEPTTTASEAISTL